MSTDRLRLGGLRSRLEAQRDCLRLAFIDTVPGARRDIVVRTVAREMEAELDRGIEIVAQRSVAELGRDGWLDIAIVVVSEKRLSEFTDGQLPRKPCPSIAAGYRLLDTHQSARKRLDLHLVVKREVTGVELLSMLVSGTAGVADIDGLAAIVRRAALTRCQAQDAGHHRHLLFGECYTTLDRFADQFRDVAPDLWKVSLALAEVPADQLDLGERGTQREAAEALDSWSHVTGYVDDGNTYRRIGRLAKMVGHSDQDEDEGEPGRLHKPEKLRILPSLPMYVRRFGYPPCLLPIRGRDQPGLAVDLYKVLQAVRVRSSNPELGLEIGLADIPRLW